MRIQDYLFQMSYKDAANFKTKLARELGISASYARHLCNGTRKIPFKNAFQIERLTNGVVSRFCIAPEHYKQKRNNNHG